MFIFYPALFFLMQDIVRQPDARKAAANQACAKQLKEKVLCRAEIPTCDVPGIKDGFFIDSL
ncbi:hypothetical protein VI06_18470 [Aquitalea magnusonii]|nr:hypothetical protein VI06_18470 [Aquitalea magnusonii]